MCSLNFLLRFKQSSRVERVLHFPRNSRCQSSSESRCFLANSSHITTFFTLQSLFSALTLSPWNYVREALINKQMSCQWVLLGVAGKCVAVISNTTGVVSLYPWWLIKQILNRTLSLGSIKQATWKMAWRERTTWAVLLGAIISTIHSTSHYYTKWIY